MESFILNIDIQFINFHILISHVSLLCIPILISQKIFLIHKIILYSNWLHKKSIIAPAALSSLHTVPASPQGHLRCCRCHAARHLPGSDCQRRSSPFLPFSASCTMSENLQSSHSSIVFFFWSFVCVCFSVYRCLTRIHSSHVVPEMDALSLGGSLANSGGEDCRTTGGKPVCSGVSHHVETWATNQAEEWSQFTVS